MTGVLTLTQIRRSEFKQTLNWTTPRVRTPQQADRWTWLVVLAYTQLRLARRTIEDVHRLWEAFVPCYRVAAPQNDGRYSRQ